MRPPIQCAVCGAYNGDHPTAKMRDRTQVLLACGHSRFWADVVPKRLAYGIGPDMKAKAVDHVFRKIRVGRG